MDASLRAVLCEWCEKPIPATARRDARFCCKGCRQTAFRLRRRRETATRYGEAMRFAYADPPYPGCAWRYYRREEVDHRELVARLVAGFPDGWALSTSAKGLRDVLPLCPVGARVCAWVKPNGPHPRTEGLHNLWEPLIVVGGRQRAPGVADWLRAKPARGGGDLPGRKPLAFCAWLFDCLGMQPGDELEDLFPGTGVVSHAWREVSRGAGVDASPLQHGDASTCSSSDASPAADDDASSEPRGDVSSEYSRDTSPAPARDAFSDAAGDASPRSSATR